MCCRNGDLQNSTPAQEREQGRDYFCRNPDNPQESTQVHIYPLTPLPKGSGVKYYGLG